MAVASAGRYANHLHLKAGYPSCHPTSSVEALNAQFYFIYVNLVGYVQVINGSIAIIIRFVSVCGFDVLIFLLLALHFVVS